MIWACYRLGLLQISAPPLTKLPPSSGATHVTPPVMDEPIATSMVAIITHTGFAPLRTYTPPAAPAHTRALTKQSDTFLPTFYWL